MPRLRFASLLALALLPAACGSNEASVPPEEKPEAGNDAVFGDAPVTDTGGDATVEDDTSVADTAKTDSRTDTTTTVTDTGTTADAPATDTFTPPFDGATADAGPCTPPVVANPPVVEKVGDATRVLLKGTVVLEDSFFVGEVLVDGDTITCADVSCAGTAGAATASVVQTNGIIMPGLIDTHNHILFDIFDETDWSPKQAYGNHDQWPAEPKYSAMVDTKQWLNGEVASTCMTEATCPANWTCVATPPSTTKRCVSPIPSPDLGCEMDKFGELKGLVAGTTSIAGSANPNDAICYRTLARTIDQSGNGLPTDKVQAATLFPSTSSANAVCANFTDGDTTAYLIHVAEGVDTSALSEWAQLGTVSEPDNCLFSSKTTIVHGTALGDAELTAMAGYGMKLTWSPRSNVYLYGAGTDLTKTTKIPLALAKGINVAISPDWSMGGSQNMLDELRYADHVDNNAFGNILTPKMLFKMATINAAKNLALEAVIGSIAVGKKADLMVIGGNAADPYAALLAARPADVRMVMVGGATLYGDPAVQSIAQTSPPCETIDICCATKFVCVAQSSAGGTAANATNKFGQSYATIKASLEKGLADYDGLNVTANKFAPLTPLVRCN